LNNILINYIDPVLGPLVLSYDGGAKSDYSENLNKIDKKINKKN
jgi:hypothetical protein